MSYTELTRTQWGRQKLDTPLNRELSCAVLVQWGRWNLTRPLCRHQTQTDTMKECSSWSEQCHWYEYGRAKNSWDHVTLAMCSLTVIDEKRVSNMVVLLWAPSFVRYFITNTEVASFQGRAPLHINSWSHIIFMWCHKLVLAEMYRNTAIITKTESTYIMISDHHSI